MGKIGVNFLKGIILEHITDLPLLGLNVNPLIGIQEQAVSIENPTLLGRYDPCRRMER